MNNEVIKNSNLYFFKGLTYSDNKIVLNSLQKDKSLLSIDGDYLSILEELLLLNILNNRKVVIVTKDDEDINLKSSLLNLIKLNINNLDNLDLSSLLKERITDTLNKKENLIISKINLLSREIDKKIDLLRDIHDFFVNKDTSGLTVLDMYTMSNRKVGKCDNRYEYYKTFIEKRPFMDQSYEEVKNAVNNILEGDISTNYNKYKRFNNNKSFDKIKKDLNIKDFTTYKNKIKNLFNDNNNLELRLNKSEYTDDFTQAFILNKKMTLNDLKSLAANINKKYNYDLINNSFKYKKPNPLYWIKKKRYLKKVEEDNAKYIERELAIYMDLEINNKLANKALSNLAFLEKVLNTSEYDKLISKLLNEENIKDNLLDIKKTLENYETFTLIKSTLTSLSSLEEDILDYCYNNIGIKNQTNQLLNFIPELYVYSKIEDVENSKDDKLHYYCDYEIILNEVYINLLKKKELLSNVSSNVYYNNLNTFIKDNKIDDLNKDTYIEEILKDDLLLSNNLFTNTFPLLICNEEEASRYLNSDKSPYNNFILVNTSFDYVLQNDIDKVTVKNEEQIAIDLFNFKKDKDCFKNEMHKDIITHLTKLGYSVERNVNLYNFLIDILVYNKKTNEIILCIECDSNVYSQDFTVEKDDVFKKVIFEEKGIKYIRLWGRDWWNDKRYEINKITSILEKISK